MTNIEQIERVMLGTILLDDAAFDTTAELSPENFCLDSHRRLLTIMRTMRARGLSVDPITLVAELQRMHSLEALGGMGYVTDLTSDTHRSKELQSLVQMVKENAARRQIHALCLSAMDQVQEGESPEVISSVLQTSLAESQRKSTVARDAHVSEYIVSTWDEMREQMDRPQGELLGVPTGIAELDEIMQGWQSGELTYVGGLPGRGKTSFFVQCMYHAAVHGFGVGCISLEMRASQLVRRLAVLRSGMRPAAIRDPQKLSQTERGRLRNAMFSLDELPIRINDTAGMGPGTITSLARKMHSNGARAIFVDFVQIIREDGRDRREAIDRISAALRDTAKSLQIPFIVASQLARKGDQEKEPRLQDLKESGSLEQDAHNVIFVHRPQRDNDWTGEDKIIIAKQREGVIGDVELRYDERTLTFKPRAHCN